jgi:hypothetical protein
MSLIHYVEIENFKSIGNAQRITLAHPAVIIGPNNCGKTSALQAIALWSQALKTWYDARGSSSAKERTATGINRLNITAVPVKRIRYFWHRARVHTGKAGIPMTITVGIFWEGAVVPVGVTFRQQGDEVVYCTPTDACLGNLPLLRHAADLNVELLYPMSGLTTEEPILKPGRINVLLGQGETAQVLRNLCLMVHRDAPEDWAQIVALMKRLFGVALGEPTETTRGSIELHYRQPDVREPLDLAIAGRGFQQMLLIFAYLYSHKRSVLMIDEPDAHLEILRQKQVYALLRDIAAENGSQIVLVTHSEVILEEALDTNVTLLLDGVASELADKKDIRATLKSFGADHYVKARERGYVLYVEGSTDIDMLRALAQRIDHPVAGKWDERINAFYVQNCHPERTTDSELERVEGGFGISPTNHFFSLRNLIPGLKGVAILDGDAGGRSDSLNSDLRICYWRRYEAENYFITPELLTDFAIAAYADMPVFDGFLPHIQATMDQLVLERIFAGSIKEHATYKSASPDAGQLIWIAKTERIKLSDFAEEYFRRLAARISLPMLLRKGELHRLVSRISPQLIADEVKVKLDLLLPLFEPAQAAPVEDHLDSEPTEADPRP